MSFLYKIGVLTGFIIIIIIIIITSFQEDNIFDIWQSCQSNIWSSINKCWHDIIKINRHACAIIYSMYRVDALRTPIRLRAGYPTLLQWMGGGGLQFSQAQDQPSVTTHVRVGNRIVSHSFDVVSKMYKNIIYSHFSPAQYQKRYLS